jgi:predicted transcriptional regulator
LIAAEEDVREGLVVSHEEVVAETAKWFQDLP